jgi:hypothetical protein
MIPNGKTLRSSLVVALLAGVSASGLQAATDYYRLSWRADPATTMVIGWRQSGGTGATVHYGTTDHGTNHASYPNSLGVSRTTTAKGMTHEFSRLTGLQPDTAYYFVVRDSHGTSARMWFRTAPNTAKDFSIVAGGDSRNNRTPRQNANRLVSKLRPLFVMFGGDYTDKNTDLEWSDWMADWQLTKSSDGRMYPVIATRGNHDDNLSLVDMFDIPSSNVYYALPVGGSSFMRVYTLNSEITPGGTQGDWLANDLANHAGVKWKLAQFHKPFFPHVAAKAENGAMYSAWAQAFYDRGVALVIDSDSHCVKHTWPLKPTGSTTPSSAFTRDDAAGAVYVGEGTWGAPLRAADDNKSWTRDSSYFNGFHWVHVRSDRLEVRTVKVDNVANVGSVSDTSPLTSPSGLDVWSPANGSVITITPRAVAATTTVSFQQGANGYAGATDTKIRSDATTTNYGAATVLEVDGSPDYAALLRFDLSAIPAGRTITSVSLSLNVTDVSTQVYEIYALRRSWSESSATWNQAASGVNWSTVGANSTTNDRESTVLGTVSTGSTGVQSFAFNTAGVSKVQAWVNTPSSNHGFVIQDYVNNSDGIDFSSKENGTVSLRPKLTVTYQ